VDAVQHVASPILLDASDPNEVIGPAVNGTVWRREREEHCYHIVRCDFHGDFARVKGIQ
jgi:hypothetical protein